MSDFEAPFDLTDEFKNAERERLVDAEARAIFHGDSDVDPEDIAAVVDMQKELLERNPDVYLDVQTAMSRAIGDLE